ncbi:sodium channel protein 60E isoform X3 [Onthophagus taurus]|uniref:sodium channel protein 60E isoform X3 n=1 Tax=Onthophagus taurus TaxID=166361 RepID=UPI000C209FDB|nr:sodium channel protein 60E-like isoform X1 [Onthophagus taurus]
MVGVDEEEDVRVGATGLGRPRRPVSYPPCASETAPPEGFDPGVKRNSVPVTAPPVSPPLLPPPPPSGRVKAQVKPFTKESLERLERKTVQLVREYGFQPRRKLSVEDGSRLPAKYEPFPPKLYGRPLEEIDNFIYDETFCVVSKRFRKNYIHRFTATNSFFLFSPWSRTRKACIYLSTNQYFDYIVMATILLNCVFLAMTETIEEAEYIFLAIYTAEMIIKGIAKGFILNKYTYLRNPWNWLDFVVITSGYATIGMEVGNLAGLRTFRVLRALKTISILPGLKTIINALLHSFKQLAEVMTLTIFCLMVFALFALQVYKGELRNKCVLRLYDDNITHESWHNWTRNPENWLVKNETDEPLLCGNVTGSRHCPLTHICLCVGENPNHGYTSFDNFLWSMLTTFQLITLDYWENVYNMVLSSCGPISVSFFTVVVFFGSFYLINLMLAVVALSYEEEAEITQEERKKELVDHREDSTFSFDPTCIQVKKLSKHKLKKIDARKGVLLSSYTRKKTRRRKRQRSGIHPTPSGNMSKQEEGKDSSAKSSPKARSRSVTPSPSPSPKSRVSSRPQALPLAANPVPKHVQLADPKCPDTLRPSNTLAPNRLGPSSRQTSSNSEGNNRESSLDDSGVVDDHEDGDVTSEDVNTTIATQMSTTQIVRRVEVTPVTLSLSPKDIKVIKCNGIGSCKKKQHNMYTIRPDYLSHIVVIDDIPDRNCSGCEQCCIDYAGWLQFQQALYGIVKDPLFELTITVCIVLNTMFLAMEHHGMSESVLRALDIGNKVFTSIFTFECCLKLMALSKEFFECGWNIFDLIIVSASLLDLIFELVDGLSVLRGLRLLRVLKLAQSWITMKVLLSIIISTIGALGNLTFVLVIVIYIFAVIGMQLFSKDYSPDKFYPDDVPRWNFTDFFHSFMMIFRILCGEWIEPLWDCMRAEAHESPGVCLAVFLPTLVMGNFMVLNLFLALLLNSFNSEELKTRKEVQTELHDETTQKEVGDESKLAQSFDRIRDIVRKKKLGRVQEQQQNENNSRLEQIVREVMQRHAEEEAFAKKGITPKAVQQTIVAFPRDKRSYQEAMNRPISIISYDPPDYQEVILEKPAETQLPNKRHSTLINGNSDDNNVPVAVEDPKIQKKILPQLSSALGTTCDSKDETSMESVELKNFNRTISADTENEEESALCPENKDSKNQKEKNPRDEDRPWQTLVSYVDELTVGGRRNSKGQYVDGMGSFPGFGKKKKPKVPPNCFPPQCYDKCPFLDKCIETNIGQQWTKMRTAVVSVVDTPAFEWFILVLIFASSVTLCFEDIHLDDNPNLKSVLYWTNLVFSIIFIIEMGLKWLALGFHRYFTSFWTLLDFLIVFVSLFSLLIEENENLRVLRSLRTLRALRPLRAISRWQGMRIVVNALMYAIPSIFNVLLVCLVFWLIFSIMGVQFFSGKFFKCIDADGAMLPITEVDTKDECHYKNYTWVNSKISFDHVGIAYLALFQVATFEGWMEVMADAVDARGVDLQPQREANLYAYIYFVIFIVCGSFFTLNLFIGVIIDNFNMLKKKYEGGVLEMFLTESQKHYYTAMKKLGRKKPQKVIKRPMNQFLAMFYDLSNSRRFEIAIFVLIFLNMLTMGIEHYDQPHAIFFVLEVSNAFFTTVFGLEAIVKIIGLRYHYFTVPWNVFDFLLVLASILGILMEDIMIDFPVSPTLLRVVRVFRIGRILRLIKAAKGIRKLLFALVVSLPALFNIGALLALITFIYAIIGMFLFGHVRQQGALDDMVNFQTFARSMHLLFRLITSAGWNDVLESLMVEPPDCDRHYRGQSNGDCGYPLLAIIYFTSFIIINYMIVINMYIAIILENFNQAHQEEEIGIVEDDLEMFYIRWSKYDPHATQFIRFSQLSDFIASLDPPLGISKPNTVALVSFNLPIAKGNRIHCLDILHALVKHVLGHVEETDTFRQLQEQMDIKFKKQFPTRKELEIVSSTRIWKRQDKAARLIQRTYRNYVKRKREKEREALELEDGQTQTSSPGDWKGRLSAFLHVHRGSRASSRKSSRASDASDLSELGGPWLNLPLLLLSSATNMDPEDLDARRESADGGCVSVKVSAATPDAPTTPILHSAAAATNTIRRKSLYNFPFFLRHQDAVVDDNEPSPPAPKKLIPISAPTLHPSMAEDSKKIRGSIIRRKRSSFKTKSLRRPESEPTQPDVSILVTEASPESPNPKPPLLRQQSETVVHVLVHRESEEYREEEEQAAAAAAAAKLRKTPSESHLDVLVAKEEQNS